MSHGTGYASPQRFFLTTFVCLGVLLAAASGQQEMTTANLPALEADLSSPRATVKTFLAAMNNVESGENGELAAAVACLDVSPIPEAEREATAPLRARNLFTILDSQQIFLEDLPATPENDTVEIPITLGEDNTIELSKGTDPDLGEVWRFSADTVENIPVLYTAYEEEASEAAAAAGEEKQVDPRYASPRATMRTYIEGMHKWDEGGKEDVLGALDLSALPEAVREERGQLAAEQMLGILDRFGLVLYQTIPDAAQIADKETYTYPLEDDIQLKMHKIRAEEPAERVWKFAPETIANAQAMFDRVYDRAVVVEGGERIPRSRALRVRNYIADNYPALKGEVFSVEYWQWIGLIATILAGMTISRLLIYVLIFVLGRVFRRENLEVDAQIKTQIKDFARPVRLMFMAWVWLIGLSILSIAPNVQLVLKAAAVTITYGGAIWAAWKLIDIVGSYLRARADATASRFDDLLVPLVVRTLKIVVVVAGVIAIVHAIVPAASTELLAGVGIGGLALALAARDAIANVFGSLMIIAERPFEIGDWIQVGDIDGSVESVGMRSTRVRTFYNSLVTIPNSELVNVAIDNYGKRKYRRIKTTLGVTYDTPPETIEAFCEGIRQLIREHPYTRKDYFHVYFNDYGAFSLDILVYCFVQTPEWGTELRERHRLMVDILRLAHRLGVEFAFPTQTNLVQMQDAAAGNGGGAAAPEMRTTYDAMRMGRKHAATIVEESIGRGMKPPPVDYAAAYPDVDELVDAHKGGQDDEGEDGDGNGH